MIDTIAPELDQIVTRKAKVRMPPLFRFDISRIWSVMMSMTAFGANRLIIATDVVDQRFEREEARDRDDEENRREQGEEKVVGLLRGQVEDVVVPAPPSRRASAVRSSSVALAGEPACPG